MHPEYEAERQKAKRAKKRKTKGPWIPRFVGVDGESFLTGRVIKMEDGTETEEQAYCLLYRSDMDYTLYDSRGLSTYQCLQYLTEKKLEGAALVGFFLNFDTEWILKDLEEQEYKALQKGEEVIFRELFKLSWIPHKRLEIQKLKFGQWDVPIEEREYYKAAVLLDTQGFFQTSFVQALKKWGFEDDPRLAKIISGKKARGGFEHSDLETIEEYNRLELELLDEMMHKVYQAFISAYDAVGLEFRANSGSWAGPGWFASDFLQQTDWSEEHPHVPEELVEEFWAEHHEKLPQTHDRELHEFAAYLRLSEIDKPKYTVVPRIRDLGGLQIRKGQPYYTEFVDSVPVSVRRSILRKDGRRFDDLADQLHMTVRELLDVLSEATTKKPGILAFYDRAAELFHVEHSESPNYPYPFSLAYYGGRIELAGIGTWQNVYNYDINSAYPYALSLLPTWKEEDFKWYKLNPTDETEQAAIIQWRQMGMMHVHFEFPREWSWYPFPVRRNGNVFYPRTGATWVMSPEFFAVWDTLRAEEKSYVKVWDAFIIEGTDGYGDATKRMPEDRLSKTARMTLKLAEVRLHLKKTGGIAERALKLILNSLYGKTIQQVGAHKYFQDFAASWITSTCRAILWRSLAEERRGHNIIMTMTDGLYSRVPLPYCEQRLSEILGEFEKEEFSWLEAFKPGIYRYEKKGKVNYKIRGFLAPELDDKEKLFGLIHNSMHTGQKYTFPARAFLTRNLCLTGWKREPLVRQFVQMDKDIETELRAKRSPNAGRGWVIPDRREHVFFYPKWADFPYSECYELKFQDLDPPVEDEQQQIEEYLEAVDAYYRLEEFDEI